LEESLASAEYLAVAQLPLNNEFSILMVVRSPATSIAPPSRALWFSINRLFFICNSMLFRIWIAPPFCRVLFPQSSVLRISAVPPEPLNPAPCLARLPMKRQFSINEFCELSQYTAPSSELTLFSKRQFLIMALLPTVRMAEP